MKMTTQEFLDHLEIEVGKPFMCGSYMLMLEKCEDNVYFRNMDSGSVFATGCSWLLDKEITPLPKYTLTEDEKALSNGMKKGKLKRFNKNSVSWEVDGITVAFFMASYFKFIEEPVSLDELRKCL